MGLGTTRWLVVGLLCLGLWPMVAASAQETRWDSLMADAAKAYQQADYAQAEPLYQRLLAIVEKALGPDHPNVATFLGNYADLLRKMKRDAEADKMEARAQAIRAKHAQEIPQK